MNAALNVLCRFLPIWCVLAGIVGSALAFAGGTMRLTREELILDQSTKAYRWECQYGNDSVLVMEPGRRCPQTIGGDDATTTHKNSGWHRIHPTASVPPKQ